MAILNNLIVRGATRCLNTLYANSLQVDSQTISGNLTVNGYTYMGYSTSRSDTKLSVAGITNNQWYRSTGNVGWYNDSFGGGVYMSDSTYVRTYNDKAFYAHNGLYTGASGQYYLNLNGKLNAADGVISNVLNVGNSIVARNVSVTNTLRAAKYDLQTVTQMGTNGTLYVAPSIQFPTSNTTSVAAASTSITIIDTNITSDVMAGVVWRPSAKVKISGTINGVVTGTVDGTITSINTSSKTMVIGNLSGGNWSSVVAGTYTKDKIENLNIMMYETYQNSTYYPVGILLTSYGSVSEHTDGTAKTYIDIYGGSATKPVVRLGNMTGLDAINGVTPSGWGLYTSNGYFSGLIVSTSGKIGGWSLSTNSLTTGTWGSSGSAMLCTGSTTQKAIGGSPVSTSGWVFTAGANFGVTSSGALYANSAHISGEITATSLTLGTGVTIGYSSISNPPTIPTTVAELTDSGSYLTTSAASSTYATQTAANNAAKTATTYITDIDSNKGIKIKPANASGNNYLQINSSAINFYRNNVETLKIEDSAIRVGKIGENEQNVYIADGAVQIRDNEDILAKFGSDGVVIGDIDNLNIKITNDRMIMYSKSTPAIQLITGDEVRPLANTIQNTFPFSTVTTKTYVVDSNENNFFKYSFRIQTFFDIYTSDQTSVGCPSFHFGTSASRTIVCDSSSEQYDFSCSCTIEYDGAYTFTIKNWTYSNNIRHVDFYIDYDYEEPVPNVVLGTTTATSFGAFSVTEGNDCQASGDNSHAEGEYSKAIDIASHAEGAYTEARGSMSHAEGYLSDANGYCSHAQNYFTIADSDYQTTIGKYNISDSSDTYSFIIGNGSSDSARSNALTVDWDGNLEASGDIEATGDLNAGGNSSIGGNLTVTGSITSGNPPFKWRSLVSSDYSATIGANDATNFVFPTTITMPNIDGYTRFVVPRTSNNFIVATGWAFDSNNNLTVYLRNLRSTSSTTLVRAYLFYLRNDLQWS